VGTGCSPTADGLALALGDPFGEVLGEEVAMLLFDEPRLARTIAPMLPSSRITTIAMIAGTSHGGRSEAWSRVGRRGAGGLRAGVGGGMVMGAGAFVAVAEEGIGATYGGAAGGE